MSTNIIFPRGNHAGVMQYKNGQTANYGSIRIENGKFYHYTGKGKGNISQLYANRGTKKANC